MLAFHHYLKANARCLDQSLTRCWEFPPLSSWVVFTDQVSHAALSGQFALEQTLVVPWDRLVDPSTAPVAVLERLCGMRLTL